MRIPLAATVVESLSKARALRTKPCQRAAEGPSSTAWTRPQILARGPKALNRLLLPAPATKQEPPMKGTAPELDTEGMFTGYGKSIPAGRSGNAEDLGHAVAFLSTNCFMTGQVIDCSGGSLM